MTTTHTYRRQLTPLLIALIILLSWSQASTAVEIVLRQQVTLQGPVVRLGDVADLSASTDSQLQDLIATPLMPAPAPGTRRYLRIAQIRDLLAASGISLAGITFHGTTQVAIQVPKNRSPGAASQRKPAQALMDGLQPTGSRLAARQQVARGRTKPPEPKQSVVVLARTVERGMLVRAVDVEVRDWAGRLPLRALRSLDRAVGMVARQTLRPGVLLLENHLEAPRLVERGETVTVFARTGGIQVRTHAVAKQDGGLGDLIQVETADRRERFMARVTGLRELDVFATGATVAEHTTLHSDRRRLR